VKLFRVFQYVCHKIDRYEPQLETVGEDDPTWDEDLDSICIQSSSASSSTPPTSPSTTPAEVAVTIASFTAIDISYQTGVDSEVKVEKLLSKSGIDRCSFQTENDLKKTKERMGYNIRQHPESLQQVRFAVTPDFLFNRPVIINGKEVNWIDSKHGWMLPPIGSFVHDSLTKYLSQVATYRLLFGPGLVYTSNGYFPDMASWSVEGVTYVSNVRAFPQEIPQCIAEDLPRHFSCDTLQQFISDRNVDGISTLQKGQFKKFLIRFNNDQQTKSKRRQGGGTGGRNMGEQRICSFWDRSGRCRNGEECRFMHGYARNRRY